MATPDKLPRPVFPPDIKNKTVNMFENLRNRESRKGHRYGGGRNRLGVGGRHPGKYSNRGRGEIVPKQHRRTTTTTASPTTTTESITITKGHVDDHEDDHESDLDEEEGDGNLGPFMTPGVRYVEDGHSHDEELCQPISSQHKAFIQENLPALKAKCDDFQACTNELYSSANFHGILQGEPLRLSNICGLMYANGGGRYTTLHDECTNSEREAIRENIGTNFAKELTAPQTPAWRKLDQCIKNKENPSPSNPAVKIVCSLTKNSTVLCDNTGVEDAAEGFFNHELKHLHCSCEAIRSEAANVNKGGAGPKLPQSMRIAIGCGIFGLILTLIIVVIILCVRHRKMKKRLSQHRIKYLPSPHDEASAVYQEIGDLQTMSRDREPMQVLTPGYHFLERAPTLPARFVRPPKTDSKRTGSEDNEYLEPLPEPIQGQQNPSLPANSGIGNLLRNDTLGQGGGCNAGEPAYDLARNPNAITDEPAQVKHPSGNDYERIVNRNNTEEDGGYSTLRVNKPTNIETGQKESDLPDPDGQSCSKKNPEDPKYFILEPQDDQSSEHEPLTTITQL